MDKTGNPDPQSDRYKSYHNQYYKETKEHTRNENKQTHNSAKAMLRKHHPDDTNSKSEADTKQQMIYKNLS